MPRRGCFQRQVPPLSPVLLQPSHEALPCEQVGRLSEHLYQQRSLWAESSINTFVRTSRGKQPEIGKIGKGMISPHIGFIAPPPEIARFLIFGWVLSRERSFIPASIQSPWALKP